MQPYEIVAAPYTVYLAPVGTSFPALDVDPPVDWTKLGSRGAKNYNEEGVTVTHEQTVNVFYGLGSSAPQKAFRSQELLIVAFQLHDVSAAQYAKVLNDASTTDVTGASGEPNYTEFSLLQGLGIATFAMLVRGEGAGGDSMISQYQVPRVFQRANPAPNYNKGGDSPAGLTCEWAALDDVDGDTGFGKLLVQTGTAA